MDQEIEMMKKPEISKDAAIFSFMAGVMPPLPQDC
jgi:hypothetical protein